MDQQPTITKLESAIAWACLIHQGQIRDGEFPLPYVTHPIEVLMILRDLGNVTDEAVLLSAILHDAVESSNTTLDEIESRFGFEVAQIVAELTRTEPDQNCVAGLSKPQIWQLRSEMLLSEINQMTKKAKVVKLADRLSNLRQAHRVKSLKKLKRYQGQSRAILELIERDICPMIHDEIKRLC